MGRSPRIVFWDKWPSGIAVFLAGVLMLCPVLALAEDAAEGEANFSQQARQLERQVTRELQAFGDVVEERMAPLKAANPWMSYVSPSVSGRKAGVRTAIPNMPTASFNASVKKWWRGGGDPDLHFSLRPRDDFDIRLGVGSQRGVGTEKYLNFSWSMTVGVEPFGRHEDRSISYYQERRRLLESLQQR